MPQGLLQELQAAKSVMSLSPSVYHQVVRILFDDISQYTGYPTSQQYNGVCTALLRRFPALQDRVVFAEKSNAVKHKTWLSSLGTKFKMERGKMKSDTDTAVQAAQLKFGHKRPGVPAEKSAPAAKIRRLEVEDNEEEDSVTIEQHRRTIVDESNQAQINGGVLNDRMQRTLSDRRTLISAASISEVLSAYLCLALDSQLVAEVQRLTGTNVLDRLNQFLSADRAELLLRAVRPKKAAATLLDCIGKSSTLDITTQKRHCALLLLPVLFGEPVEEWFVMNKDAVRFDTNVGGHWSEQSTEVALLTTADNTEISHPSDIMQGVASMFSLYWVYDISYCSRLQKTKFHCMPHVQARQKQSQRRHAA